MYSTNKEHRGYNQCLPYHIPLHNRALLFLRYHEHTHCILFLIQSYRHLPAFYSTNSIAGEQITETLLELKLYLRRMQNQRFASSVRTNRIWDKLNNTWQCCWQCRRNIGNNASFIFPKQRKENNKEVTDSRTFQERKCCNILFF